MATETATSFKKRKTGWGGPRSHSPRGGRTNWLRKKIVTDRRLRHRRCHHERWAQIPEDRRTVSARSTSSAALDTAFAWQLVYADGQLFHQATSGPCGPISRRPVLHALRCQFGTFVRRHCFRVDDPTRTGGWHLCAGGLCTLTSRAAHEGSLSRSQACIIAATRGTQRIPFRGYTSRLQS